MDWVSYIVSLAKTGCKEVGAFIPSKKFLSSKVGLYLSKYVIQSCLKYCLLCLYELVLLVAILISRISYRSKYVGLLVICMLLLWNPWLIIEIYSAQVFSIGIILVDVHANWLNCLHLVKAVWLPGFSVTIPICQRFLCSCN